MSIQEMMTDTSTVEEQFANLKKKAIEFITKYVQYQDNHFF